MNEDIKSEVVQNAKRTSPLNVWKALEAASPFLTMVNLPVAVVVGVVGIAGDSLSKGKELDRKRMPDSWLNKVAKAKTSEEGLFFLSQALKIKGYVSVSEAFTFLEIEKKYNHLTEEKELDKTNGAEAILSKFERNGKIPEDFQVPNTKLSTHLKETLPKIAGILLSAKLSKGKKIKKVK